MSVLQAGVPGQPVSVLQAGVPGQPVSVLQAGTETAALFFSFPVTFLFSTSERRFLEHSDFSLKGYER